MQWTDKINVFNEDCIPAMREMDDDAYDLAIVDPPYGIDDKLFRSSYGKAGGGALETYAADRWDKLPPSAEYFEQLFRVSKNQIIWGANYFLEHLPSSRGVICWDKEKAVPNFSAWEMAWTSFDTVAKIIKLRHHGFLVSDKIKIHPTQKPVKLYRWLLEEYADEGMSILDTHHGSGSIAIACHHYGCKLDAYEISTEMIHSSFDRFKKITSQTKLF